MPTPTVSFYKIQNYTVLRYWTDSFTLPSFLTLLLKNMPWDTPETTGPTHELICLLITSGFSGEQPGPLQGGCLACLTPKSLRDDERTTGGQVCSVALAERRLRGTRSSV